MKRVTILAACGLFALTVSCKAKEQIEKAAIAADLSNRGTTQLLKDTEKDQYNAPADRRLTAAQIEMYMKVRQHEKDIAKVAKAEMEKHANDAKKAGGDASIAGMTDSFKALGSWADVMTADIRAAKDLGYNTAEYRWVKEEVLKASGAQMTAKIAEASQQMMDAAYQQTKKQYDEAKDEQSKKMLGEMLAGYDKSKKELAAQQPDAAVEYNRQLLSKYEDGLNALAVEMSKFETHDGDAQKQVQQWQQSVDKAAAEAKANAQK